MNIAAYCRVSTDKEDQLNSLEAQKASFTEYTARTGDNLVRLYADEGISGTKIKNRKEFLRMMSDAEHGLFEEAILNQTFKEIEDITDVRRMTNTQLKKIIQRIEVDKDGNVDIYLRLFGELGLDETILISNDHTFGEHGQL